MTNATREISTTVGCEIVCIDVWALRWRNIYSDLSLSLSLSLMEHKQIYLYIYIYIIGYSGLPRIVLIQRLPDQVQEASSPHWPHWNEPSILPPIWKFHISQFTNPKVKFFSRGAQTNIVKREILKSSRGMSPIEQPQTKCKFKLPSESRSARVVELQRLISTCESRVA